MTDYTMAQAKRDFDHGHLVGANILRPGMHAGVWCIQLVTVRVDGTGWLVDARTKQAREFKTLDAAFSALLQVGMSPESLGIKGRS